jgi:hypothetical protein
MNTNEPDYFECNEDCVDNFDILNDIYRKDPEWIRKTDEITKQDLNPLLAFKSLYLPGQSISNLVFDTEYREGTSDPYQRILNLKYELIDCKSKIDSHAKKFNENEFLKQGSDIGKVLEELDLYKSKIDAFIDYNLFNKTNNDDSQADDRKDFQSIFDKYNRLTENLITQVKQNEKDILNDKFNNFNIKYEICANPQLQMESLIERVDELEEMMNNLENNIGNWNIVILA